MLEEAKKRDHRKLGREMELFCFDDDVGPGLPLWLPKGAVLIEELEKLAKETEFAAGYQRVRTPHIARESMYLCSGHLPYYADSMFPPMELEWRKSSASSEGRKACVQSWKIAKEEEARLASLRTGASSPKTNGLLSEVAANASKPSSTR